MKVDKQQTLIADETNSNNPDNHWIGMPEFVQEKQKPFAQIICRFETQEDLDSFSQLIGQKLTPKTKSIWHPFKSHWGGIKGRYKDES